MLTILGRVAFAIFISLLLTALLWLITLIPYLRRRKHIKQLLKAVAIRDWGGYKP